MSSDRHLQTFREEATNKVALADEVFNIHLEPPGNLHHKISLCLLLLAHSVPILRALKSGKGLRLRPPVAIYASHAMCNR